MSHNLSDGSPSKITIEDLLRLKRAERPDPEFWNEFEQELRAKQLAAIMVRRPWWLSFQRPFTLARFSRLRVPAGAAAALILAFVVAREYAPSFERVRAGNSGFDAGSAGVPPSLVESRGLNAQTDEIRSTTALSQSALAVAAIPGRSAQRVQDSSEPRPVGPGGLLAMIPWAGQPSGALDLAEPMPLGNLPNVDFVRLVTIDRAHDFQGTVELDPVVMPGHQPAAELASMPAPSVAASPRELRRNRILSNLVLADNTAEIDVSRLNQVREVVGDALDDDRIYDSVRRVGMGGDRLTLKF